MKEFSDKEKKLLKRLTPALVLVAGFIFPLALIFSKKKRAKATQYPLACVNMVLESDKERRSQMAEEIIAQMTDNLREKVYELRDL